MPTLVAIANIKGGAGKTTSTIHLAVEAHRAGVQVGVVDADPSQTAFAWAAAVPGGLPFTVKGSPGHNPVRDVRGMTDCSIVLVDSPPADRRKLEAILDAATLAVVPVKPNVIEARELYRTMDLAKGMGTTAAVLVVGALAGTVMFRELDEFLEQADWPRFRTVVPFRQDFARSFGTLPDRTHGYSAVWAELHEAVEAMTGKAL